jgi:hypothetical protein
MPAPRAFFPVACLGLALTTLHAADPIGFEDPRHGYFSQPLRDPFSVFTRALDAGQETLAADNEQTLLQELLRKLKIPASSQMLVFSATSFQTGLISVRNPRAIYFNEDTYLGHVPGGRVEIISIDPDLGAIFYLLDRPAPGRPLGFERSERCMNCHAPKRNGGFPGLVVESMIPGPSGGGERSYRGELSGHALPFFERFGGWHVTGLHKSFPHQGNLLIEFTRAGRQEVPVPPGARFDWQRYPTKTSDVLAHVLHEHQVGFINRCVEATYRTRHLQPNDALVQTQAEMLLRYLLFADEAPLPPGGLEGDPGLKEDFLATRRPIQKGPSLKDFDLRTRLFRYRCSYMIYSQAFTGLPPALKKTLLSRLEEVLTRQMPGYDYLPAAERQIIREILRATLPGLPPDWGRI